jgi:hypothetical protein
MVANAISWPERFRPDERTALAAFVVVNLELAILWTWLLTTAWQFDSLLGLRYVVYPLVWINVGLWALWRTVPAPTTTRRRALAGGLAVGYFLVLAYAGGLIGPATQFPGELTLSFSPPPGFSPALLYDGSLLKLTIPPYKLVGYLALAYLVYATIIDAAGSAISGLLGLLSCVSCTWPIAATLLAGFLGSGTAVASAAFGYSYDISVVVFVLTIGLLYWRPTVR